MKPDLHDNNLLDEEVEEWSKDDTTDENDVDITTTTPSNDEMDVVVK